MLKEGAQLRGRGISILGAIHTSPGHGSELPVLLGPTGGWVETSRDMFQPT